MSAKGVESTVEHDEELCRRVIADPKSATHAERNFINGWPTPEEEDRLCIFKTGRTHEELKRKALTQPETLTYTEAKIVSLGVLFDVDAHLSFAERQERHRLKYEEPSPLQALMNKASKALGAARDEVEKTVVMNAYRVWSAVDKARRAEQFERWREHDAAKRLARANPWIIEMLKDLEEDGAECWGFVFFRTGCYGGDEEEAAWAIFRKYFDAVAEMSVLHWNSGPLLWPKFRAVFIEDSGELDGASDEQLRERFRKMRDEGELPNGIRTSCFLVADKAVLGSEAAQQPYIPRYADDIGTVEWLPEDPVVYIRAVDPDYGTEKAAHGQAEHEEMAGYKGQVTVALPRVFDWLHWVCFEAERGGSITGPVPGRVELRQGWRDIYVQTKVPEAWTRNWGSSGGVNYRAGVPLPGMGNMDWLRQTGPGR
jgi:hypothetical protein